MIKIKKSIIFIHLLILLLLIIPSSISGYLNIKNISHDFKIMENTFTETFDGNTLYVGGTGPNNYSKIQNAIDNASDGDTIYVFNGIYNESISIDKSITLKGEDQDKTIITSGIQSIEIDNIIVNSFTVKDTIEVHGGSNITISENTILDDNNDRIAYGIVMYSGTNNIITGNTIINFRGDENAIGIYIAILSNSVITGNTFRDIQDGSRITIAILGSELSYCDIKENLITEIHSPYFYGFMLSGSNITVNDNTIRNIYCNGSHSLFLYGSNIMAARNTITDIDTTAGFVIGLEGSSYSILEDNTIKNISGYMCGIDLFESSNNTIKGNSIEGTTLGIWLIDSHYTTIDNNNIRDCKLILAFPQTGIGIFLTESTYNLIIHNIFKNNHKDAFFDFEHICNEDEPFEDYKKNRDIPDSFDRNKKDLSNIWENNYWNRPRIRRVKITGTLMVTNHDYTDYYIKTLENYDNNPQLIRTINNPILRSLENHPRTFSILRLLLGL